MSASETQVGTPHHYPAARCPQCGTTNTDGWPMASSNKPMRYTGCNACWERDSQNKHYDDALSKGFVVDITFGLIELPGGRYRAFLPFSGEAISGWGDSPAAAMMDCMTTIERTHGVALFTNREAGSE